jgi:hypothetical protein
LINRYLVERFRIINTLRLIFDSERDLV